jgi:autotransporter-associated beta strand protein
MSTIQLKNRQSFLAIVERLWCSSYSRCGIRALNVFLILLITSPLYGTDPIIQHSGYQSIVESPPGSGNWTKAFSGPYPFRLIGVVINDSEDYLDPTAHYDNATPWYLGGQAQIYVQAVNLDGTQWDPDPNATFNDFGGTACWMGQNYGNLGFIGDPFDCYDNTAWYNELDRLQIWHPGTSSNTLHAGDLVEIRTSVGGLYYNGMMNVNEKHSIDSDNDFEVVVLSSNYGLPTATQLTLSNLKNADNSFIFNPAAPRDSGVEHYQSTLVELKNVHLNNPLLWGPNMDIQLADDTGRDMDIHLGLDAGFYSYVSPTGTYDVTGILDQESANGRDGYRLVTLKASYFSALSGVAAAPVWSGGGGSDNHWRTAANWSASGSIDGWELHFDGSTSTTSINDYANDTAFYGIVFNPNATEFTLSGNSLKVKRVANFSNATQTVDLSLNTDNDNCLFLAEPGDILVSKPIVGSHGLEKYGSANLILTAVNTYTGTTDIESGLVILSDGGTIDSASDIQIASGASLEIDGGGHHLGAISGQGDLLTSNSTNVSLESFSGNIVTLGDGCTISLDSIEDMQFAYQNIQTVPEPGSLLLLVLGLAGLTGYGVIHRKNRQRTY